MATAILTTPFLAPRPSPWSMPGAFALDDMQRQQQHPQQLPMARQVTQATPTRSRRDRPCDGCRRRKSKCVLQPSRRCVLCEFHKQDCTFVEDAQPRKRKAPDATAAASNSNATGNASKNDSRKKQTTAAASSLTSEAKKMSRNDPGAVLGSSPKRHRSPTLSTQPPRSNASISSPRISSSYRHTGPASIGPVASSPPSELYTAFDPASMHPHAVDDSLSLQRHRHCRYLGHTTPLDASLLGLSIFDDANETNSQLGAIRQVATDEYFSLHADGEISLPDDEARALAEIDSIIAPHGPTLIDVYFRNVHPSYPILQKQIFLDRHRRGDRQFNPPLLAAIYLLALGWWDREPSLAGQQMPDVTRLEYIAVTSLTVAMQRPKISAVQAGLLLLQRAKENTWTLTVQLVALSQDIGLHLDCSDWAIPAWECRLRKRLAWALYMQDKWTALTHGRPSHINTVDWAVPALTDEDFDIEEVKLEPKRADSHHADQRDSNTDADSSTDLDTAGESNAVGTHLARGRVLFTEMIALTAIMADVCATFYSQTAVAEFRRAGKHATQLVLNRAKPVQIKLKDWYARLPTECKLDVGAASDSSSTIIAIGSLHLAYFATEITIHRRIVRSLVPSSSANSTFSPDPYMLYICRTAAKTRLISAMDFVNRLTPQHLQAFWYFASPANLALIASFGALLQATSPGREEAAFYAARRREFRWTLGVSLPRARWIQRAVEIVETSDETRAGFEGRAELNGTTAPVGLGIASEGAVNGEIQA